MLGIPPSFELHPVDRYVPPGDGGGHRVDELLEALVHDPTRMGSVHSEHRNVELTDDDVRLLTHEVVAAEGRGHTPFGAYLFGTDQPAAELARHVERAVFGEAFACSPEVVAAEYDHYEPSSLFVCVLDHRRCVPVGAVRVVVPGAVGFKSLDEIGRHWHQEPADVIARTPVTIDLERTWDIATLMVCPGYRTGTVSQALHQAVCTASRHAGVTGFITILDVAVLRLLQFQLRKIFTPYDGVEARYYEGSPSQPVWSDLTVYCQRLRRTHPDLYETIFEGANLEAAVSAPDWDDALRRVGVRPYGSAELIDVTDAGTTAGADASDADVSAERRSPVLTGGVGT